MVKRRKGCGIRVEEHGEKVTGYNVTSFTIDLGHLLQFIARMNTVGPEPEQCKAASNERFAGKREEKRMFAHTKVYRCKNIPSYLEHKFC